MRALLMQSHSVVPRIKYKAMTVINAIPKTSFRGGYGVVVLTTCTSFFILCQKSLTTKPDKTTKPKATTLWHALIKLPSYARVSFQESIYICMESNSHNTYPPKSMLLFHSKWQLQFIELN